MIMSSFVSFSLLVFVLVVTFASGFNVVPPTSISAKVTRTDAKWGNGPALSYPWSALQSTATTGSPTTSPRSGTDAAEDEEENWQNATSPSSSSSSVRRVYETFRWKYRHSASTSEDVDDVVVAASDDDDVVAEERYYDINYRAEGPLDGPKVLLIHGFGANVNHFRYNFPALVERGYRVYAADMIGFGASDKPPDVPYSIELFTDVLEDFVREIDGRSDAPANYDNDGDRWIVAGNSIGGLCSLTLADRMSSSSSSSSRNGNGGAVRGIVLFNCAGGMSGFRYEDVPALLRPILYFVQTVVLGPSFGGRFFENFKTRDNVQNILSEQGVYCNPANVDDDLLEILLVPGDDHGAKDVFLKVFAGPPGPTPESLLTRIDVPVLALWGDSDPWTPLDRGMHPGADFQQYATACPQYDLVVLPGVGHCPHDEAPKQVHDAMIPWLDRLVSGKHGAAVCNDL